MIACWSIKGGVGTSTLAAGLALARAARRPPDDTLLVDLGGDLPDLFGVPDPGGPGVTGWLAAGEDVPSDAVERLATEVAPGCFLLPRGDGAWDRGRADAFAAALQAEGPGVVVDVGVAGSCAVAEAVLAGASTSYLVVRACPLSLAALDALPARPTGVVVVRDRRRAVTWRRIGAAVDAPVVAELEIDPAVGAAADAGLLHRPLPRRYLRVLGALA